MNAQSISRFLADAGHRPLPSGTPRTREGIRVTNSVLGYVTVMVDHDSAREAIERTDMISDVLLAAGYGIERIHDNGLRVVGLDGGVGGV